MHLTKRATTRPLFYLLYVSFFPPTRALLSAGLRWCWGLQPLPPPSPPGTLTSDTGDAVTEAPRSPALSAERTRRLKSLRRAPDRPPQPAPQAPSALARLEECAGAPGRCGSPGPARNPLAWPCPAGLPLSVCSPLLGSPHECRPYPPSPLGFARSTRRDPRPRFPIPQGFGLGIPTQTLKVPESRAARLRARAQPRYFSQGGRGRTWWAGPETEPGPPGGGRG